MSHRSGHKPTGLAQMSPYHVAAIHHGQGLLNADTAIMSGAISRKPTRVTWCTRTKCILSRLCMRLAAWMAYLG